jgi:hypothetical protein
VPNFRANLSATAKPELGLLLQPSRHTLSFTPGALPLIITRYIRLNMQFVLVPLLVLVAAPVAVFACEGECIIGITNAFLGNYSTPIHAVLDEIVSHINLAFIQYLTASSGQPNIHKITHSRTSPPLKYLTPLIDAYNKAAYSALETAIFPSYFHGKCQNEDGTEPEGCPNPDCPVVCGTPGSLVHFYAKLRSIAYEETSKMLVTLASPGSESYKAVEKAVVADADPGEACT